LTGIHADIDALKGLHGALVRYRHAQRDVTARGQEQLRVTRASLEAKASRCRTQLELSQAELGACQDRAAGAAGAAGAAADDTAGGTVDCSGYARAVEQCGERLEVIRRWQQRIDAEAGEFQGIAGRFADLLENELPRMEEHLVAIIASLEAARRVQAPAS
jgi:hypothetical protein